MMMSRFVKVVLFSLAYFSVGFLQAQTQSPFGFGREVGEEEIKNWDIDVRPDGAGLPPGQGSVIQGETVYEAKCLACHGEEGQGGPNDQLVARFDAEVNFSLGTATKAIGNYWPYATTLYDYINRAMPHNMPGSLNPAEIYSVIAYLLYLNGIVDAGAVMDKNSLPAIEMPARPLFYWSEEAQP